jgi:hypothetical protein
VEGHRPEGPAPGRAPAHAQRGRAGAPAGDAQGGYDTLQVNGYTFHFYDGTYIGADGTTTRPFIPNKKAIITPDLGSWFRYMETTETIPVDTGLVGSVDEMISKTVKIYGDFAYMAVAHNPLKFSLFCGCNFFYGFANPSSVWCATIGT